MNNRITMTRRNTGASRGISRGKRLPKWASYAAERAMEQLEARQMLTTIQVNNFTDGHVNNQISLREAIDQANSTPGLDTITFSGSGAVAIKPVSALSPISDAVVINGGGRITLDGSSAGNVNGLNVTATNGSSTIKGLTFIKWKLAGIMLAGSGGNVVTGNTMGPRNADGIVVGSPNNRIGGLTAPERNVIASNNGSGITVQSAASGTLIQGNFIGTSSDGLSAAGGSSNAGIVVSGTNTMIGGTAAGAGNLIAGNDNDGIQVLNAIATAGTRNQVVGNSFGLGSDGMTQLDNVANGVTVKNSSFVYVSANNFFANDGDQVSITDSSNVTIQGNIIGVTRDGSMAFGGGANGIEVMGNSSYVCIGGSVLAGQGNVISGSSGNGIYFNAATGGHNTVKGNLIGTDDNGALLGNVNFGDGIDIQDSSGVVVGGTSDEANVISHNQRYGIYILGTSANNSILHNSIYGNINSSTHIGQGIRLDDTNLPDMNDALDADAGPNHLQNYPENITATRTGTSVTVAGELHSLANSTFTIEFFANSAMDSAHREGHDFIGSVVVTTNASGLATFSAVTLTSSDTSKLFITATATLTDAAQAGNGDTSEFSDSFHASVVAAKITPSIVWNPANLTYGTGLGASQLNARAMDNGQEVTGTYTYTPLAGTILHAGLHQQLQVTFTPDSTVANLYNSTTGIAFIDVAKATPTVSWATPTSITYGTALSGQFNATASVAGGFVYAQHVGQVLDAGQAQVLSATFTPDDAVDYNSVNAQVLINVDKATLRVTGTSVSKTYGDMNPSFGGGITGLVGNDAITAIFDSAADQFSGAGAYAITPTLNDPGIRLANYNVVVTNGTLTINKAPLFVTAGNGSRAYGAANPNVGVSYSGFVLGDGPSVLAGSVSFTTSANHVGTVDITPTGLTAANYDIHFVAGHLTVTPVDLSVKADDKSMDYGGAMPILTATITGLVNGDTAAVLTGLSLSTVDPSSHAGTYDITASGAVDGDYIIHYATGALTITKVNARITVNGFGGIYDGSAHGATGSATGVLGEDLSALLNLGNSFTNAGDHTTPWSFAGNTDYNPGNGLATISIAKADASFTITPYALTYNGGSHSATGSATGVKGEDLSGLLDLSATAHTNAGSFSDAWSFAGNDNYNFSTSTVNDSIVKANAVVVVNGYTGTYDGSSHSATGSASGVEAFPADLSGLLHIAGAFTNAPGGAAHWTFDGDANYNTASGDVAITISKANADITVHGYSGTYDGLAHGATGSASGVNHEDLSALLNLGNSFTNAPGGTAAWSFPGDTNYNPANGTAAITISKATALVTVTPYSVTYNGASHSATGSARGVNGEDLSGLLDLSATAHTNAGSYVDAWSFAGNDNYDVAASTVNDSIAKANASIVVNGYSGTYDSHAHSATGSASGVSGEDLSAMLNLGASFTSAPGGMAHWTFDGDANYNTASGDVAIIIAKVDAVVAVSGYGGTYDGHSHSATGSAIGVNGEDLSTLLDLGNSFTNAPGGLAAWSFAGDTNYNPASGTVSISISKASLILTPLGSSKIYGQAISPTGTLTGLQNGDNVWATFSSAGAPAAAEVGSYDIAASLNDPEGKLSNYDLTTNLAQVNVTPATLTINANSVTKIYGQTVTLTGSISGVLNNDGITPLFISQGASPTANVGSYAISDPPQDPHNKLHNYHVVENGATVTVLPAPLTVVANNAARAYGDVNPNLTGAVSGLVNGDVITGVFGTTAIQSSNVGSYPITASLSDPSGKLGNYAVTSTAGALTVSQRAITITADAQTKQAGAADPALTWHLTSGSLFNADAITGALTRVSGEATGTYAITQGSLTAGGNYAMTYVGANLTITAVTSGASISGSVYTDLNNSATRDSGEAGISNVLLTLLNSSGATVATTHTDSNGNYTFSNLVAGAYTIKESQPCGYVDGEESAGTVGGVIDGVVPLDQNNIITSISLQAGNVGISYNFGELPEVNVTHGDAATIGFWQNKNGQALIKAVNGGATSLVLAKWLSSNFPNLFGATTGSHNLIGKANTDVASLFVQLFKVTGMKVDAQVMAVALAVYMTDSDLAGTAATKYGFNVSTTGTADKSINVGSNGAAFDVANNTNISVWEALSKADEHAVAGKLFNGNTTLQTMANTVFNGINNNGDIV
jgi:hypothetical protein